MVDQMEDLEFDPFFSEDNSARKDFVKLMQTPYQDQDLFLREEPGRIPQEMISNLDYHCISDESDFKAFEYYSKISDFWTYRSNNGLEERIAIDLYQPDIPSDCPSEVSD